MTTYRWDTSRNMFVDKKTGKPMEKRADWKVEDILKIQSRVVPDVPPHIGPSGRYIANRHEMNEEMKRTDCVPRNPRKRRPYLNPMIAKRNGEAWNREYATEFAAKKAEVLKAVTGNTVREVDIKSVKLGKAQ
jgi:hypothetical protein